MLLSLSLASEQNGLELNNQEPDKPELSDRVRDIRNASEYLPARAPATSVFSQTVHDSTGDSSGTDITVQLVSVRTGTNGLLHYTYRRFGDDYESGLLETTISSHEDTLYTTAREWFRLDVLDEIGIGIDPGLRVDLMRLSVRPGEEWVIKEHIFSLPVPQEILDEIPSGVTVDDTMDILLRIKNKRLEDGTVQVPFSELESVVFKPSIDLDLTLYVKTFFGLVAVTLNILDSYGMEIHFSPEYGIVKEAVEAVTVRLRNQTLGIEQEIGRLPGRTLMLQSFEMDNSVSAESDREGEIEPRPDVLVLHPAYPNPFNPATAISFELREPGEIEIRVYDISGRLIDSPAAGRSFGSGRHSVLYQADRLSSGTYLYMIRFRSDTSGDVTSQTGSFTLLK